MKRILFILLLFTSYSSKSQILSDSVRPSNCHHDGAIFLDIINGLQVDNWFFEDDSLGWIVADTMLDLQLNVSLDTLVTNQCGSYIVVLGTDTSYFFIGCKLGISAAHQNILCFGDSSGSLKKELS
jgi:hypothetical protein